MGGSSRGSPSFAPTDASLERGPDCVHLRTRRCPLAYTHGSHSAITTLTSAPHCAPSKDSFVTRCVALEATTTSGSWLRVGSFCSAPCAVTRHLGGASTSFAELVRRTDACRTATPRARAIHRRRLAPRQGLSCRSDLPVTTPCWSTC